MKLPVSHEPVSLQKSIERQSLGVGPGLSEQARYA